MSTFVLQNFCEKNITCNTHYLPFSLIYDHYCYVNCGLNPVSLFCDTAKDNWQPIVLENIVLGHKNYTPSCFIYFSVSVFHWSSRREWKTLESWHFLVIQVSLAQ